MKYAGVDIASEKHFVAVVDEAGAVIERSASFAEDAVGYVKLFGVLGPADGVGIVALEATGTSGRTSSPPWLRRAGAAACLTARQLCATVPRFSHHESFPVTTGLSPVWLDHWPVDASKALSQ
jgi:hypothetical protein